MEQKQSHPIGGAAYLSQSRKSSLNALLERLKRKSKHQGRAALRLARSIRAKGTALVFGNEEGATTQKEFNAARHLSEPRLITRLQSIENWLCDKRNEYSPQREGVWSYYERLRDLIYPNG